VRRSPSPPRAMRNSSFERTSLGRGMTPDRIIHGDDLLYRFFQEALRSNQELFAAVPQLLITTMAL
jgi:hypothetical protein